MNPYLASLSDYSDLFPGIRGMPGIPQLAELWEVIAAEVREIAPVLAGVPLSAAGIAAGGPTVAAAYLELEDLAAKHQKLRVAQTLNRQPSGQLRDVDGCPNPYAVGPGSGVPSEVGRFFDCAAVGWIDPAAYTVARTTVRRAGPDEPLARLLWLASDPEARAWVPTPEEQDRRYLELSAWIGARRQARRSGRVAPSDGFR